MIDIIRALQQKLRHNGCLDGRQNFQIQEIDFRVWGMLFLGAVKRKQKPNHRHLEFWGDGLEWTN